MNGGIVYHQLLAVKHQALGLAKSVDILLAQMDAEQHTTDAAPAAPAVTATDGLGNPVKCQHPLDRRIPIPAMGEKRFKCMDCNEDVKESEVTE